MPRRPLLLSAISVLSLLLSVFAMGGRAPSVALASTANSVTIAGDLDQVIDPGCGQWNPACAAAHLTDTDGGKTYWAGTWTLPAGAYQYKSAINDSWDENYGLHAAPGGDNIALHVGSQQPVSFYYDHTTHWVTDNVNSVIATTPGDFQTYLGCSGNWDPSCLRTWLEDPSGSGTYSYSTTAIPAGHYQVKAAINRSWDTNYGAGGAQNGDNIAFTVPANGSKVVFSYNPTTHALTVQAGHSRDNNVEYNGLAHNSQDSLYRVPFGAVTPGTPVILRFRTFHNDVTGVKVRLYDTATSSQAFKQMSIAASNVSCYDAGLSNERCDFWQTTVTPTQPTTLYYRFIVTDGTATAYYADTSMLLGGLGQATPNEVDNSYALTVYSSGFQTIPWMRDGVIYQIFPDRFNNGSPANDPVTAPDGSVIKKSWNDLPEGYCQGYVNPATPCTQGPHGRDYFGGDLTGIVQKLPYLRKLGVTVIYLNPIFASGSNHGYDTHDYMQISPYFGTAGQFQALTSAAHDQGIKIVLDGVFNHVGSSSLYFDRYHQYATDGACESTNSPYRSWFYFQDVPAGTGPCAGSAGPNSATYTSWFGFDSLPVLNKSNPQVQQLLYAGEDAVVKHWLRLGADGWRFDVMPDGSFPADFWPGVRAAAKSVKADAPLICECWPKGDVLAKATHGDQADTAMNYRFRNAILGFFGTVDNKGFPDDGASNESPTLFAQKLMSIRQDNPDASYYTMMNLMDSHDTQRILWSLTPGQNNREDKEFNAANVAQGKQLLTLARVVQMTTPGAPTIYYGDEVGVTGDTDPDDRRTFPWDGSANGQPYYGAGGDHALYDQYSSLISLRSSHPVLRSGALHFLLADDTTRTLAYLMRGSSDAGLVAVNRNSSPQTLTITVKGWLPNNVQLTGAFGPINGATAANGVLTLTLPGNTAEILFPSTGQDLTAPNAPTGLNAQAGNGNVSLSWTGIGDAASYNVYRSPVTGGGYSLIGNAPTTSYTDSSVTNGQRYYYVVRAVDAAGNESDSSNEAFALPSYSIGYAVVQYPKTIDRTVSTDYTTVYGQVWAGGYTDAGGDPDGILAQLGFAPHGTQVGSWTRWIPMSFNVKAGNNYEYQVGLRPPQAGTYDYLVRFSTNGGLSWTYGDQNGSGTSTPGVMTATANADQIPPAAPTNLQVTDWSTTSISLQWNSVGDAAEYWLYRRTADGSYGDPIATLSAGTTNYIDNTVDQGTTYSYVVKAVDSALNVSGPSNEVTQQAAAKLVAVTFNVTLPADTPAGDTIHIAGSFSAPYPTWDPTGLPMQRTDPTHATITLNILDGTQLQYKYVRNGTWSDVEKGPSCEELNNRMLNVSYGGTGTQTESDTVAKWADVDHC
jgi:glycosidase